jgi:hypothetical protein
LLRATESGAEDGDPTLGFARLISRGVQVRFVPGRHNNIVYEPHVGGLAGALREFIQDAVERSGCVSAQGAALELRTG